LAEVEEWNCVSRDFVDSIEALSIKAIPSSSVMPRTALGSRLYGRGVRRIIVAV